MAVTVRVTVTDSDSDSVPSYLPCPLWSNPFLRVSQPSLLALFILSLPGCTTLPFLPSPV